MSAAAIQEYPAPPPPPPSYAATQHVDYQSSQRPPPPPHSPTRRSRDEFSEAIDQSKYKTKMCANFMAGLPCHFGDRCAFAHGHVELRHSRASGGHVPATIASAGRGSPSGAPQPPPSYEEHLTHTSPQQLSPRDRVLPPSMSSGELPVTPSRHPRTPSGSPTTHGEPGGFPSNRFRNEPYSPTGYVLQPPTYPAGSSDGSWAGM